MRLLNRLGNFILGPKPVPKRDDGLFYRKLVGQYDHHLDYRTAEDKKRMMEEVGLEYMPCESD